MSAHYLLVECNIELNSLHDMVRWELRLDKSTSDGLVANRLSLPSDEGAPSSLIYTP